MVKERDKGREGTATGLGEGMSPAQFAAIRRSLLLAREIQISNPEIAEQWASGSTYQEIGNQLGLTKENGINPETAKSAIRYAIKGYNGGFEFFGRIEPFLGLIIDGARLNELTHKHKREGGRRGGLASTALELQTEEWIEIRRRGGQTAGIITRDAGTGIFARTPERHSADARKGGQTSRDRGVGFHGMTEKEKKATRRKAIIAQGRVPWEEEEIPAIKTVEKSRL